MSVEHLSDESIQTYLEDCSPEAKAEIELHLSQCSDCRGALDAYRAVFSGLTDDSDFELSTGFAAKVRAQVEAESTVEVVSPDRLSPVISMIVASAAVVVLVALHYFVGWGWLGSAVLAISSPGIRFFDAISSTVSLTLSFLNGGLILILMGGSILAFFGLLDRLLVRHRV